MLAVSYCSILTVIMRHELNCYVLNIPENLVAKGILKVKLQKTILASCK
jgi:hypothetical protein